MDILALVQNTSSPLWAAFLLGLVFAFDPCPMLTNIAAIGYIGKDVSEKKNVFLSGLWYTLGRTLAYGLLGIILIILLKQGESIFQIENFFSKYGEKILIPFLIIIGVLMIISDFIPWLRISVSVGSMGDRAKRSNMGAMGLGALLSLAFCPTNAILFFGMLIPMAASTTTSGYAMPILFALATALPVVLVAWVIAFSLQNVNRLYGFMTTFGKWIRWGVGLFFILLGLYLAIGHIH